MDEQALADIANGLYAVPLEDFVTARTAAAKEAAGQDKELGTAVKALPKPSVAAWAVNMLALHQPDVLAGLADLGARMRDAQASLDAPALRELGRERRAMLSAAVDTVRTVVQEKGRAISDTIANDVEETLRALTADEGAAAAVRSGRLLKTLSADGVSAADLEGAVAVPAAPPARTPAPAREKKQRTTTARTSQPKAAKPRLEAVRQAPPRPVSLPALEKAKTALAEAQEEEARTSGLAQELQEQVDETQSEIAALVEETAELRNRLKSAEEQLDRARKRLAATAAEAKQAARAADKAGRTAMLAQERVLRLGNTRG